MSTTEEKSTNSSEDPTKKEDEQQAVAAAAETAKDSKGDEGEAAAKSSDEAADAPDDKEADKPAVEASTSEASEDSEETDELDIEVEAAEETPAEVDPVAELKEQIVSLEAAKKNNYDRLLRAMADLENYRKRSRRDVKDARLDERGKILRDMLPVIDNLERAVAHAEQSDNEATKSIVEGVNLVLRQFSQALERHQVTPLDAVGKTFDPAIHEAVSQAPSAEHPPGTILSTLQSGYMMDGRLLRPSLVVVSVAAPAEAEKSEPEAKAAEVIDAESTEGTAEASGADESASKDEGADAAPSDAEDGSEESAEKDAEPSDDADASDESAAEDEGDSDEKKDGEEDKG